MERVRKARIDTMKKSDIKINRVRNLSNPPTYVPDSVRMFIQHDTVHIIFQ